MLLRALTRLDRSVRNMMRYTIGEILLLGHEVSSSTRVHRPHPFSLSARMRPFASVTIARLNNRLQYRDGFDDEALPGSGHSGTAHYSVIANIETCRDQ
jgi:hypothetical protein